MLRLPDHNFRQRDAHKIRGYISQSWKEFELLHNHLPDGRTRYSYPLIQYKVISGTPLILALGEGIEVLEKIFFELKQLEVGKRVYDNLHKELITREVEFGDTEESIHYQFVTPWLALNQPNYRKFRSIGLDLERPALIIHPEQVDMLQSIMVRNITAVSKALGYTLRQWHKPVVSVVPNKVYFKNQPMVGFRGSFAIKFLLPDFLGLGKSVARGFGTVKRVDEAKA
ncbi:MAG: DNA repair protein [Methanobacteriota archaeon]|nr:MAG: DNA repair protein [Euryarchaeota archaeon]